MSSPVGGRLPSLGGSKSRFRLALFSRQIDKCRVSATPVYTLATPTDGAWCHSHLACYFSTVSSVHVLSATTAAAACCRKNREHYYAIHTHCMMEFLRAGPDNGKTSLHCEYRIEDEKKKTFRKITKSGVTCLGRDEM